MKSFVEAKINEYAKGEVLYTDEDFDPQRNHQII
jgi:hypothetical protein